MSHPQCKARLHIYVNEYASKISTHNHAHTGGAHNKSREGVATCLCHAKDFTVAGNTFPWYVLCDEPGEPGDGSLRSQ